MISGLVEANAQGVGSRRRKGGSLVARAGVFGTQGCIYARSARVMYRSRGEELCIEFVSVIGDVFSEESAEIRDKIGRVLSRVNGGMLA